MLRYQSPGSSRITRYERRPLSPGQILRMGMECTWNTMQNCLKQPCEPQTINERGEKEKGREKEMATIHKHFSLLHNLLHLNVNPLVPIPPKHSLLTQIKNSERQVTYASL